jgi:hypothetical protein
MKKIKVNNVDIFLFNILLYFSNENSYNLYV